MKQISVEIIHKCPNRCLHCSSTSGMECTQKIETEKVKEIIDGAVGLQTEVLSISGGEPFLHPGLAEIVQYAKKKSLAVYLYTSGVVFNSIGELSSIPDDLLEALRQVSVDRIIFNLPAITESIYDCFTGTTGNQKFALESIHKAQCAGIEVEFHFVPTKLNIGEIDRVIEYAEKEGIRRVSFLGLVPHGRAKRNRQELFLDADMNRWLKEKLGSITSEKIRIGIPLQQANGKEYCYAGKDKLCIRYDGKVFGCEAFKYIELKDDKNCIVEPDSIYEIPLEKIYMHSKYLQLGKQFVAQQLSCGRCGENCPIQQRIRGITELLAVSR